jgi:hypothetical protein
LVVSVDCVSVPAEADAPDAGADGSADPPALRRIGVAAPRLVPGAIAAM